MSDAMPAPSAPARPANPAVRDMILSAPEELWKKIQAALGVASREEAAAMAEGDENVAAQVMAILENPQTLLTSSKDSAAPPLRSAAESLYPSMGGGRRGKGVTF